MQQTIQSFLARGLALAVLMLLVGLLMGSAHAQNSNGFIPTSANGARAVQYLLRARGQKVAVDGVYGTATRAAMRRFQKAQGLETDGKLSFDTWQRLFIRVRRGSKGDAVRAAQCLLNEVEKRDEAPSRVDGIFGFQTELKTRRYQKRELLKVDGIFGQETWTQMLPLVIY